MTDCERSTAQRPKPRVGIVLPTYNRATFLPEAFRAIRDQHFSDWELYIIDDGSSDGTREVVAELAGTVSQSVRYLHQENQGAARARNVGIASSASELLAFYDSDDVWLPHHLSDCVAELDRNPDVDWIYTATAVVDLESGSVISPNVFYEASRPKPVLSLATEQRGRLKILSDPRSVEVAITHGLYAGLQTSVIRRRVFLKTPIPDYRVGEDQVLNMVCLKKGYRVGYLDDPQVLYRVHGANLSVPGGSSPEKRIATVLELARAFDGLTELASLSRRERTALRKRLGDEYFWNVGYALQESGRAREALTMFRQGLGYWPWDFWKWKTYLLSLAKGLVPKKSPGSADSAAPLPKSTASRAL